MGKTIKITTDNKLSVIDMDFNDFRDLQRAVGGHFECVRTQRMFEYFGHPVMMIVDEEGILKNLPTNRCGSWMYGTDKHGHRIAGDIVFAVPTEWGDIVPLDDLDEAKNRLLKDFDFLEVENG